MGIDDSHRLQAGVDDGGPHELHAPVLQVLGNAIRQLRADHACLIDHLPFRPVPEATVKAPTPAGWPGRSRRCLRRREFSVYRGQCQNLSVIDPVFPHRIRRPSPCQSRQRPVGRPPACWGYIPRIVPNQRRGTVCQVRTGLPAGSFLQPGRISALSGISMGPSRQSRPIRC